MTDADKMACIVAIVHAHEGGESQERAAPRFALRAIRDVLDDVPSHSADDIARLTRELGDLWSRLRELEPYEHIDNTMTCRKVRDAIARKFKEILACIGPAGEERDPAGRKPVCDRCNDTHWVTWRRDGEVERRVMCQFCPLPCQQCRACGNGPFCEKTPCPCECHKPAGAEGEKR